MATEGELRLKAEVFSISITIVAPPMTIFKRRKTLFIRMSNKSAGSVPTSARASSQQNSPLALIAILIQPIDFSSVVFCCPFLPFSVRVRLANATLLDGKVNDDKII